MFPAPKAIQELSTPPQTTFTLFDNPMTSDTSFAISPIIYVEGTISGNNVGGRPLASISLESLPVVMYHSVGSISEKNSSVCFAVRVSDQIGTVSRSRFPCLSMGTTPRLCPERARHSTSSCDTSGDERRVCVDSTTASHQSVGLCSCQPATGYSVS